MTSQTPEVDPALLAALVQDLESLRRAGARFVGRVSDPRLASSVPSLAAPPRAVTAPAGSPPGASRPAAAAGQRPQPASVPSGGPMFQSPRQDLPVPRATSSRPSNEPEARSEPRGIVSGDSGPLNPPSGCGLNRAQRDEHLSAARLKVAACRRCAELASTRTQTVFGVGDPMTKIVFIGEAPGADEDKRGEPFVGKAGQLLDKIIEASQLKREEIYIANVLKCRPPGNRTPTSQEADNCWEYLTAQLTIIDPDYIVCWGSVAAQTLLKSTTAIGKLRGRFHTFGRAKVLCTYHPSYLLRNPSAKKDVWDDMKFWRREMGVDL